MPRTQKSSKFFLYTAKKSGHHKGKMLLGTNHEYEGGQENITLQDLIDFLKENKIEPTRVELPGHFITTAKV
jgi:hypothetical protein